MPLATWECEELRTSAVAASVVWDILPITMPMKYRDVIRLLERDGWGLDRTVGSHMQFRHPAKAGTVTVPSGGKLGNEVPPGTLNSILKQAGLK